MTVGQRSREIEGHVLVISVIEVFQYVDNYVDNCCQWCNDYVKGVSPYPFSATIPPDISPMDRASPSPMGKATHPPHSPLDQDPSSPSLPAALQVAIPEEGTRWSSHCSPICTQMLDNVNLPLTSYFSTGLSFFHVECSSSNLSS